MGPFTIEIPVKPHTQKYLEVNYGTPAELSRRDNLGTVLFLLLDRESHDLDWTFDTRGYTSSVSFNLSSVYYHRRGLSLTKTNVIFFNNIVEEEIKKLFRLYVQTRTEEDNTGKLKTAIDDFNKKYNLSDEDLPYETAKKDFYRHRLNVTNSKSTLKKVC